MTSILKADDIQDSSGNNIIREASDVITIGASGDTITIPSGATLSGFGGMGANDPSFHAYNPQNGSVANLSLIHISEPTRPY